MGTIHLVYVKREGIRTPQAITNELSKRLSVDYPVIVHDWAAPYTIHPEPGDILIGHPHPSPDTVFRKSFALPGWHKRLVMLPYRHAPYYSEIAWWDPLIRQSDRFLAICAPYWTDTMGGSWTSHWAYKTIQLDLAVNRDHFPFIKSNFSPVGKRRFLFIGLVAKYKGFDYLLEIVRANPHLSFGWIGPGDSTVECPGLVKHGYLDFEKSENLELVKSYDYLLTCGRSDPNPTTILEAAAWGLVPVCTPQSGYYKQDWVINIPLDDVKRASSILSKLNHLPEESLIAYQRRGLRALTKHYTWDRFAEQVKLCIDEAKPHPPSGRHWQWINIRNRSVLYLYRIAGRLLPYQAMMFRGINALRVQWWRLRLKMRAKKTTNRENINVQAGKQN